MSASDLDPLLPAIVGECLRCHPAEACGLVLAGSKGALRFVAIENIAGSAAGSNTSSRTLRDGYVMDPKAMMAALQSADDAGESLAVIVHSHPEVGAYFSSEDKDMALGGGAEPLWPGVDYLVVSVRSQAGRKRVDEARLYRWSSARRDFDEIQVPGIAALS